MRKIWVISILGFVFLVMAACSSMYYKGERVYRARGTVETYEPGKMITLRPGETEIETVGTDYVAAPKDAPKPVFAYAITSATEVKGDIKPNTRVLIRYTQQGTGDMAPKTAVSIDSVWHK